MDESRSRKSIIAYLRVSTKAQGKSGVGLEGQLAVIASYAEQSGFNVAAVYKDVASGMGADSLGTRSDLQVAIARAQQLGVPLVVSDLSRLTRHAASIEQVLNAQIDVIAVSDDLRIPTTVRLSALAARAQHDGEKIAERTRAGQQRARDRGVRFGNPTNLKLAGQNGNEANRARSEAKIQQIAEVLALTPGYDTLTKRQIAELLNSHGVQTSRGNAWTKENVRVLADAACERLKADIAAHYKSDPNFGRF